MAAWLKQSTAVEIAFGPFVDQTDGVSVEAGLTISQADVRLKKNGGNWAQKNDSSSAVHEENGWYRIDLDSTDTNTLGILVVAVNESGALAVFATYMVVPANVYDSAVLGTDTLDVQVTGIGANVIDSTSIASNAVTAAKIATDAITASKVADGTIDAATFASGAIDATAIASNAITAAKIASDAITAAKIAADAITSAKIATGAIDADAIATDAVTEILAGLFAASDWTTAAASIASMDGRLPAALVGGKIDATTALFAGIADSGTTTTFVDAAITALPDDQINGNLVLFTGGNAQFNVRLITDWNSTTNVVTFTPAATAAIAAADTYQILPFSSAAGGGDLTAIEDAISDLSALVASSSTTTQDMVDAVQDGIDIIGPAVTSIQADTDNIQTRIPAALVGGRMDSSVGAMATGTITAAAVSSGAGNKIADHTIRRTLANVAASSDGDSVGFRSLLGLARKMVNKISISGSTLTIFAEDDSTSAGTQTLTSSPTADPITSFDTT